MEDKSELSYKNHVEITSGSFVRFTSENYVIKPCKWEQKMRNQYVMACVMSILLAGKKHQPWVVLLILQPKLILTIIKTYHSAPTDPQLSSALMYSAAQKCFCIRPWIEVR